MKSKKQIYLNVMLFLITNNIKKKLKALLKKKNLSIIELNTITNLSFCLETEIVIFLKPVI